MKHTKISLIKPWLIFMGVITCSTLFSQTKYDEWRKYSYYLELERIKKHNEKLKLIIIPTRHVREVPLVYPHKIIQALESATTYYTETPKPKDQDVFSTHLWQNKTLKQVTDYFKQNPKFAYQVVAKKADKSPIKLFEVLGMDTQFKILNRPRLRPELALRFFSSRTANSRRYLRFGDETNFSKLVPKKAQKRFMEKPRDLMRRSEKLEDYYNYKIQHSIKVLQNHGISVGIPYNPPQQQKFHRLKVWERDENYAIKIEKILKKETGTVVIAIGAGHINGVLERLKDKVKVTDQKQWKVEDIKFVPPTSPPGSGGGVDNLNNYRNNLIQSSTLAPKRGGVYADIPLTDGDFSQED